MKITLLFPRFTPGLALLSPPSPSTVEAQVWLIEIEAHAPLFDECLAILTPDEHSRVQRFHKTLDRQAFTLRRGLTRVILGSYLDLPPASLRFQPGPQGKPSLASPNPQKFQFNSSFSHNWIALGVIAGRSLGVDIQAGLALDDLASVAQRTFSPRELIDYNTLSPTLQPACFYQNWVRKEAYVKAVGLGMTIPFSEIDLANPSSSPGSGMIIQVHGQPAPDWLLTDISAPPGYFGAVCIHYT